MLSPTGMIRLELSLRSRRGHASALAQALRSQLAHARALRNCLGGHLSRDLNDAETLHYAEHWDDGEQRLPWPALHLRRLLAIMETAAPSPTFAVQLITATRGLEYLKAAVEDDRA